ncbi:MAG: DUF1622 domain-containing protein [Ruminococcaceae bacterium]|nr:DUF1622 domain-containing protein [Oscillospiraceae bacterium]
MLHHMIEIVLPVIISICELIGIFVVVVSTMRAFYRYLKGLVTHQPMNVKFELAQGLGLGLEFKMASEILKTVLVQSVEELVILGAVILLRALVAVLIHFEMRTDEHHNK